MTAADREPYLSASEIAPLLGGITPETVRSWARAGVIRGHQPGGRVWLFLWSEVRSDIAARGEAPAEAAPVRRARGNPERVPTARVTDLRQLLSPIREAAR